MFDHTTRLLSAEGAVSRHTLSATWRLAHFVWCQVTGTYLSPVYLGAMRHQPATLYNTTQCYWQLLKQRHSGLSTYILLHRKAIIICCVGIKYRRARSTTHFQHRVVLEGLTMVLVRVFCGKDAGEPDVSPLYPNCQGAYQHSSSYSSGSRVRRITEGRRGINKAT